jgi:YbbR domain-containing protein
MLRRNLPYKLLALVIAVIIWAYANEGRNPGVTRELKVPLDLRMIEPRLVVTSAPQTVRVSLEGMRTHVESVLAEPDAVSAYVNLKEKPAGRYILPVNVKLPEGFMGLVNKTSAPREVSVVLEQRARRVFPVDVQFTGPPPVGYRFGSPQLSPNRASASGTGRQLDLISQLVAAVDTKSATAGGIDDDFPITPLDKDGKPVSAIETTPLKVHLRLDLLEAPASRIVFVSPDVVGQPPFPCRVTGIEVKPQSIAVTGRPEQLANVTTLKTGTIPLAGRTQSFTARVRVIAPQGLALAENSAIRVTVSIASSQPKPTKGD